MRSQPSPYTRNIEAYRNLERTHKRWQTLRRRFGLTIEDAAFFIGPGKPQQSAAWEGQAKRYFATLLDYRRLERTNDMLRTHRLREGLGLAEAAFLLAGGEDIDPLPNKLRAARLRSGLGQKDVAYLIGKTRSMLSRYERGRREPDVVTAMILSVLYDLPLNRLFRQRVGALDACLKKRGRMLAAWRRARRRALASSAHGP